MNISLHLDAIVFSRRNWATHDPIFEQSKSYLNVIMLITNSQLINSSIDLKGKKGCTQNLVC